MSGMGRVSRASPVHAAVRNCTRDEGGPFGFGGEDEAASMFLLPKQVDFLMDWIRGKKEGLRSPFEPLH